MKETPPSSCYGDRPEESSPQTCRLAQALGLTAAIAVVGVVETVPAADQPTIPIIVQDTTMFFWQIVLAGARKVGSELNVNVPELGTQSDIDGQISILENAVSENPAAIVIASASRSPDPFATAQRTTGFHRPRPT
jgi:ABC-type sugar transport system substrate-binding protein